MYNKDLREYKIYRTFDEEGRPYAIYDDDLAEVLSGSDFAQERRS